MHPEVLTKEGLRLFPTLAHLKGWSLAGGTALALQIGHRVSVDFDLFSAEPVPRSLLTRVKKIWPDVSVAPLVNNAEELTVLVGGTKITFLHYPFKQIDELVSLEGIPTFSIQEIATMKAYTIGRRAVYKDYIDIFTTLNQQHHTLPGIMKDALKKYESEFNDRLFLEQLISLADIPEEPITFTGQAPSRQEVLNFLEQEVKKVVI